MRTTINSAKQQLQQCIREFQAGELTEDHLHQALDGLEALDEKKQDLLYLQAGSTSPAAGIHGMLLVQDGQVTEPPIDKWPYGTVLDAIRDGWRVIKFPDLVLMMDESRTYGLGCEFILEKWR